MTDHPTQVSKFCVYYDGDDHGNHEMDIFELGRSLTALGNALHAANGVLNGHSEDARVDVKVSADFIEGSFGVEIEIFQYLMNAKDIAATMGLTAIGSGGALAVIDWLKGKKIDVIKEDSNGKSILQVGDQELTCDDDIANLIEDPRVRKSFEEFIYQPLQNEGTSTFAIKKDRNDTTPTVTIDKEKAKAYKAPPRPVKEEKIDTETEAKVQFTKAADGQKRGWEMVYLGEKYPVTMNDTAFLARVQKMEEAYVFGKKFNVNLKKTVTKSSLGDKEKYTVITVRHESKER